MSLASSRRVQATDNSGFGSIEEAVSLSGINGQNAGQPSRFRLGTGG
jgi:hypothetical protein